MANKAFIFDMDGVLIDSERLWVAEDYNFLLTTFGKDAADKVGSTLAVKVDEIYERIQSLGIAVDKDAFITMYDERAAAIYAKSAVTKGTTELAAFLEQNRYRLALVSTSRKNWIDRVVPRLKFRDQLEVVISINDEGFPSKPAPDAFLEALHRLDADPKRSVILEDANRGIAAGKAAGCYVIGYREHLVAGHEQTGADVYADSMENVIEILHTL
jgi:HAD superfamily hydrolase (TIGR01509 family)